MLANAITDVSDFLWGWPLIIILFGTHIFMTIRTGFIQKDVFKAIKLSVTPDKGATGNVSQFGALTTALSSTIGTGNIVGVGTAIALGGPGAVLWMWITGLLGMATKYSETIIAVLLLSAEIAKDTKRYKGKHIDDVDDTEIPVVRNAKRGVLHIPMEDPNHTDW